MQVDESGLRLQVLADEFSVCRVADYASVDLEAPYTFIGRTDEEKSLVCVTSRVPVAAVARDDGWRGFRVAGVLDFSLIGILSKIAMALAKAKIGIFAVSTFNTDYIFVKRENFDRAMAALSDAGCDINRPID